MKTFLWLLFLGGVIYFMYLRAQDYGYPWQDQVVITNFETNKRYRSGGDEMYVHGEVRNLTRKRMTAEVECKTLPPGMTLTPKSTTSVEIEPAEAVPFEMALTSRQNVTGAECEVKDWTVGGGMEEKFIQGVKHYFGRFRHSF